jgi:phage/plasmid-like protein (TIGR03299 family)
MAHEISITNGKAEMAYVGDTPWHGLGTRVDTLQTADAMLALAGLTWTVGTSPLFCNSLEVEGYKAIHRNDTMKVLGVVTDRYQPIQNAQAAGVVDALITEGGAHVEVAGALFDGGRCWMLAHIPGDFDVVKGDTVRPYFLLAWGHDGKHGLAGKLTPIRVVCNNTLTAAGFGGGQRWSQSADIYVRHTRGAALQIDAARKALGVAKKQIEETTVAYQALAGVQLAQGVEAQYFGQVFPEPEGPAEQDGYEEKLARWNEHQATLLRLYETGVGADIPGVRGTAWAAYNAVTEYIDHVYPVLKSGQVSEQRQQSVLFGSYSYVKERALTQALTYVG